MSDHQGDKFKNLERLYATLLELNQAMLRADAEGITGAARCLTRQIEEAEAPQAPVLTPEERLRAGRLIDRIFQLRDLNRAVLARGLRTLAAAHSDTGQAHAYDAHGRPQAENLRENLHLSA